jgi:hypothetical protein
MAQKTHIEQRPHTSNPHTHVRIIQIQAQECVSEDLASYSDITVHSTEEPILDHSAGL